MDRWQRRHNAAGFQVAVVRKFLDDRASSLAALIAYYAFFSLFPLLLALVSILGFVLQDNPSLQDDVLDSALARIPVIGVQLQDDFEPLAGSELGACRRTRRRPLGRPGTHGRARPGLRGDRGRPPAGAARRPEIAAARPHSPRTWRSPSQRSAC